MTPLESALAKLDAAMQAHDENVLEATQLFADGKLDQDALDQAIKERDAASKRRSALVAAIAAESAKNVVVEADNAEARRQQAADKTESLLAALESCAADIDSTINALVSNTARFDELNQQIRQASRAAGMLEDARKYIINMAPPSAALARALVVSHLDEKLAPLVAVTGTHNAPVTATSMTRANAVRMRALMAKLGKATKAKSTTTFAEDQQARSDARDAAGSSASNLL